MLKILAILSLILPTALAAQDEGKPVRSGILVRAIAFSHFENFDTVELRHEEHTLTPLELPTGQLCAPVSVSARQFTCGVAEGENFRTLGNITLPDLGRDFILVFAPTKTGYSIFPVRADDPDFKGNDTFLFNFTPHLIGVMLGTAKQTIPSLKSARLRPGISPDDTFYQAMFSYEKDGKFIPFNNTRWPVNSNTKGLVFVHQDITTGKFAYRGVSELAGP